jgi:hypothetical protein
VVVGIVDVICCSGFYFPEVGSVVFFG